MAEEYGLEWKAPEDLVPWAGNPRDNDHAVAEVAASILRFGFGAPIVVWRERSQIVAGHTRVKAVQFLRENEPEHDQETGRLIGWHQRDPEEPFRLAVAYKRDSKGRKTPVWGPGDCLVPVREMDFVDEDEAHAYALGDNKLAELADWDDDLLSQALRDLAEAETDLSGLGFDSAELAELIALSGPAPKEPQEIPQLPEVADSKPGEVYELGPHRLLCGDSTRAESWARLLGETKAQLMWTDPPYGVEYKGGTKPRAAIENDGLSLPELRALLDACFAQALSFCEPGASWYVAGPGNVAGDVFTDALRHCGVRRHTLVWLKNNSTFGRADYHYEHEFVFYGWTPGGAHYFTDDRTKTTVLRFDRPARSDEHPTMKPVPLVEECVRNSSKAGWIVVDPFGGSGSTLLACAMSGRVARLIEKEPVYCDVIRMRWTRWARENGVDPGPGALEDPPE